jgi:glycerol kinase
LAVGFWRDEDELRAQWKSDRQWRPKMKEGKRVALYRGWQKAIERSLDWVDK